MNKNIIIPLALAVGLLSACKKDYTCECTSTTTSTVVNSNGSSTSNTSEPDVRTITYKKVKKSDLRVYCGSSTHENSSTQSQSGQTNSSSYKTETKCTIK